MHKLDEEIVLKYFQNQCSEDELIEIQSWLKESEENVCELFDLEMVFHSARLDKFSSPDFLKESEKKLYQKIEKSDSQIKKKLYWLGFTKYVAVAAVLIVGIFIFHYLFQNKSIVTEEIIVMVSPEDTITEVILPDGSKVWVNRRSTIKYPKKFAATSRNVSLEGEAYFEVTRDNTRPFFVHSDALDVKVLGTTFNFKYHKGDTRADVSLLEGEVEVKGNKSAGQIVLSRGQKAELDLMSGRLRVKETNTKLDAVWHNGLIPFDNASIFEIANTLECLYNVNIILSPHLSSNKYSGVLKKSESVNTVLKSLMNSIPIKYKVTNNNIYIQPAN